LDATPKTNADEQRYVLDADAEFEGVSPSTADDEAQTNNQLRFFAATADCRGCRMSRL
jgi:hypothetical protein